MIVGYARVSTDEQKLDLQISALEVAGCHRIYKDQGRSGQSFDREGLESALNSLQPGSTLVVWRLDRLGRSLSGLVQLIDQLGKREVHFRSVMENIDTSSPGGRLMFHMMAALAEFERALISERTRAGLNEARSQGKLIGRPKALTEADVRRALHDVHRHGLTMIETSERLGVSVRTLQRHLRLARASITVPVCAEPPMTAAPPRTMRRQRPDGEVARQ
ncbi:recombinase family protein [Brucella tritici]|uniref:Recombinase family protein n=1 Tax=Brucella tritici TaxID=94626 RepID=A0A7V8B0L8_9HYPH|nr:recombinase family protein [Brucella tritici]KAB2654921.1 recombinase family protein [Brucella tritici]